MKAPRDSDYAQPIGGTRNVSADLTLYSLNPLNNKFVFASVKQTGFVSHEEENDAEIKTRSEQMAEILLALGINKRSSSLTHLPPFQERSKVEFWNDPNNEAQSKRVAAFYRQVLYNVAAVWCGDAAAQSSLDFTLNTTNNEETSTTSKDEIKSNILTVFASTKLTNKTSLEHRTARALLCASYTRNDLSENLAHFSNYTFKQSRKDFKALCSIGKVKLKRITRKRYSKQAIDEVLAYIWSDDNVSFLSWGAKTVCVDGQPEVFPLVNRKKLVSQMYSDYRANKSINFYLSKCSFRRIAVKITHKDPITKTAVDYVTVGLIYENFDLLKRLAEDFFQCDGERRLFLLELEVARCYVKYNFDQTLSLSENENMCSAHNIDHGLGSTNFSNSVTCSHCKHLFYVVDHLKEKIQASIPHNQSALDAVDACKERIQLYMGHRVRVVNQKRHIEKELEGMRIDYEERHLQERLEEMRVECEEGKEVTKILMTADFKMKQTSKYPKESTLQFYAKKGMTVHGVMAQRWRRQQNEDGKWYSFLEKVYIDVVVENDTKQDKLMVFSILEAAVIEIKKLWPAVKDIVVLTDNAGCYQNTSLLLLLPYTSLAHGVKISAILHTDTQDGKSQLDAHFGRFQHLIDRHVAEGTFNSYFVLHSFFNKNKNFLLLYR